MILEEVLEEIITNNLPAAVSSAAEGFSNEVQIFFQRIFSINNFQPAAQAGDNIVSQILFVGDGQNAVFVREESLVFALVPIPTGVGQAFSIQRITAKHTANGIGKQTLDVPLQISLADGHVFILYLRGKFVL